MKQCELELDTNFINRLKVKLSQLEAQNKALTDIVEMQSEKISRLEAPKSCDGCKWMNIKLKHIQIHPYCLSCIRGMTGDFYEPKDN